MKCKPIIAAVLFCLSVRAAPQYKDNVPCIHAHHHHNNNNNEIDSAEAAALVSSQSLGRIVNHPGSQHHRNVDIGLETAASGISSQTQAVTVNTQIAVGDSATLESGATQTFRTGEGYVQGSGNSALLPQLPPLPQPTQQPPLQHPAQQFGHPPQRPPPHHFGPTSLGPVNPPPFAAHQQNHGYNYQQQASTSSAHNSHHQSFGGFTTSGSSLSANAIAPPAPRPNYGAPPLPPRGPPPPHFNGPAPYRPLGPVLPGPIGNIGAPRPVQQFSGSHQFGGNTNFQAAGSSYAGSFAHNTHGAQNGFSSSAHHGVSHAGGSGFNSGHLAHSGSGHSSELFSGSSSVSSTALNGQLGHVIRETFASAPLDPTVEKHIYVHVPPEELEERESAHAAQIPQVPAKKHYKIIFIKAPTVPAPNYAQLAAATQQSEEKTLVYVLVKKPDEPSLEELQQLQQQSVKSSKPEVYFIKYKTRKEGESDHSGPIYTGSADLSPQIDIRLNGDGSESAGINTSTSYSSTSSTSSSSATSSSASNVAGVINNRHEPHDLYGVPLQ